MIRSCNVLQSWRPHHLAHLHWTFQIRITYRFFPVNALTCFSLMRLFKNSFFTGHGYCQAFNTMKNIRWNKTALNAYLLFEAIEDSILSVIFRQTQPLLHPNWSQSDAFFALKHSFHWETWWNGLNSGQHAAHSVQNSNTFISFRWRTHVSGVNEWASVCFVCRHKEK